ncbi:MAG: hypothetical protein FWG25_00675 [Promicromonosporaceae bacterium]|nr:hypothetical protein [Promicromonosporaceae bacterium]
MWRRYWFRTTIILAALIAASACGISNGANLNIEDSPLQEFFFASVWQNAYEVRKYAAELNVRREELVAECMQDAGFHYLPDINSGRFVVGGSVFDEIEPENLEWITQFGFGIVSGHRSTAIAARTGPDPNLEYFESLSDSGQSAYLYALNGCGFDPSMPRSWQTENGFSQGCWQEAHEQAISESPLFLRHQHDFAFLFESWSETINTALDGPEMIALERSWAHCMADLNFSDFRTRAEAIGWVFNRYFELILLEGDDFASIRHDLQNQEIEIALADFYCQESTGFRIRRSELIFATESQFVRDNREALEAYRAASELRLKD